MTSNSQAVVSLVLTSSPKVALGRAEEFSRTVLYCWGSGSFHVDIGKLGLAEFLGTHVTG